MAEQLPLPKMALPPACMRKPVIGRYHQAAEGNPYSVCLTRTQMRSLFGPRRMQKAMPRGYRQDKSWGDEPGEQRLSALGCGVFACAWARDKQTVVKITNDRSDVQALMKANKARIKGVPILHRAFRLASRTDSKEPVYAMVVERLRHRAPGHMNVDCIFDEWQMGAHNDQIPQRCCGRKRKPGEERYKANKACHQMARDLPPAIGQLHDLGIPMVDLHEENVGVDGRGNWKIIDLGLSGQVGGTDPSTLRGPRRRRLRRR